MGKETREGEGLEGKKDLTSLGKEPKIKRGKRREKQGRT